jgi:hypothetical protein
MVAVMVSLTDAMHAVIHGIAMREAMHNVAAMAESQDRRRRHKA